MRMQGPLKCHGRGELLVALQTLPGGNVRDSPKHQPKERESRKGGERDRDKKTSSSEVGAGFFYVFAHRLKATEQPWHNLPHKKNGNQRSMAEEWVKIRRISVAGSCQGEHDNQRKKCKRRRLRQTDSCLYPTVIDPGQNDCNDEAQQKVWQIDRISSEPIQFMRIERRK